MQGLLHKFLFSTEPAGHESSSDFQGWGQGCGIGDPVKPTCRCGMMSCLQVSGGPGRGRRRVWLTHKTTQQSPTHGPCALSELVLELRQLFCEENEQDARTGNSHTAAHFPESRFLHGPREGQDRSAHLLPPSCVPLRPSLSANAELAFFPPHTPPLQPAPGPAPARGPARGAVRSSREARSSNSMGHVGEGDPGHDDGMHWPVPPAACAAGGSWLSEAPLCAPQTRVQAPSGARGCFYFLTANPDRLCAPAAVAGWLWTDTQTLRGRCNTLHSFYPPRQHQLVPRNAYRDPPFCSVWQRARGGRRHGFCPLGVLRSTRGEVLPTAVPARGSLPSRSPSR